MYQGVALLFSGFGEVRSWLLVSQRSINVVHVGRSSPLEVLIPYCYFRMLDRDLDPLLYDCSMTSDNLSQPRCALPPMELVGKGAVYVAKSIYASNSQVCSDPHTGRAAGYRASRLGVACRHVWASSNSHSHAHRSLLGSYGREDREFRRFGLRDVALRTRGTTMREGLPLKSEHRGRLC
ncbi:hypothetical protein BD310DRAFT_21720 [Dichomitus squalens]|uniref:Uncharacterized protein n=1 Tax=Dichomitus squalens TaxID=114155 RepID=A0A4Q9QDB2_9APHY|nr:hypothetical protein BD310DRAFT_21720 [Dichomitus squalens]